MPMQNAQQLFIHELGDMYEAEQRILKMLAQLAQDIASTTQVQQAFQMHEQQTRQQITNLDQVFRLLGTQPPKVTCSAIQGLDQEHSSFKKENPSDEVLTMFDLGAASKTEHYEIASYTGLVEKARLMGQQQAVQLLQQNLQQEQEMARTVQQLGQQLGQRAIQQMGPWQSTQQQAQPTR